MLLCPVFLSFLITICSSSMRVVNIHNIPSIEQRISIHISGNSVPDNNKKDNSIDDEAAKQFEELTQVFTIFALMDQLSSQIFNSMDENRGFLSLEELLQEESKSEKKNDFKEAHVEFIEGKSSLNKGESNEENHDEIKVENEEFEEKITIKRNPENKPQDDGGIAMKKEVKLEEETTKEEEDENNKNTGNTKDDEVIISRKTKEENKKEKSANKNILSLVLAIIIAGMLFCLFKYRMNKEEVKESFCGFNNNNNKVHEENLKMNANKGD